AFVVRPRADDRRERVERLGGLLARAVLEERGGVARLQLVVGRRDRDRLGVRRRGVLPAMLAFVEFTERRIQLGLLARGGLEPRDPIRVAASARIRLDEQRRAVLPSGFLVDELAQERYGLRVRAGAEVQPPERRARVRIGLADGALERRFEML